MTLAVIMSIIFLVAALPVLFRCTAPTRTASSLLLSNGSLAATTCAKRKGNKGKVGS
jgi:hypothetical protein